MNSSIEEVKVKRNTLLKEHLDKNKDNELFTSNQDAIITLNLEGYLVQINPAFTQLTGYSVTELKKMTFQSLILFEDLDMVLNNFHKSALGQFLNFDCRIKNKMNEIIALNLMNIPICVNDQIVGVRTVAKDVSHLKRKRSEVRKIEEYHRVLTENVLDIILTTNLIGNILYVSPSCEHLLGYTPDEIVGQHYSILLNEDDVQRSYQEEHKPALNKPEYSRSTYQVCKKDGSFIWVESICKPIVDPDTQTIIEVVCVIRDITERIQAEKELYNRKKAFRDMVEHSPDAVLIAKGGKILFINETGVKLLGTSSTEDIIHKSILDFIHTDDYQMAKDRIRKAVNGDSTEFAQYNMIRFDGSTFPAEIKTIPTFFQNEPAQHIIIRDMTERKKTLELLLNSEKLTVAGQLAAGIAHEVRNPLTAIKGFLQLMEAQIETKSYFKIIQSEIDRIELILSELLVLAKPQELKFEKVNMKTILEEVKTLIDTQAIMNNVQIDIISDCNKLTISCDMNQLKQVFINFLKNAIEAMPDGGTITIEIKKLCTEKIKIFFKDTGIGIPQNILKRIGEPFFTTKEEGTGLGIMISKQIIENHNGTVHFWSDKMGTMIEVILPVQ
ncbi:PAS domain S-box protein [Bacillus sp. CGMCC 1.16607]|uniref:PAS domain S-box protein n=1 Tax=Bacillus sp. CGMCC 1.16607 TaxID=3351842 RepID=UPI0036255921